MTEFRVSDAALRVAVVASLACCGTAVAQNIRADASWGRLPQTLSGPLYLLPEGLGRVAGSNLFHSFERFGLASGETARFTTATASLQNVFARVTGGQASVINGLVQLLPAAGSAPDLYLVNPAGMTFGAGASLDVPAAFHTGTANYIKFADGTLWQTGSADSVLISAAPEVFGFLDGQRTPLLIVDGAQLEVAAGLTLAAGDIAVRGANVYSDAGDIIVVAAGGIAAETPRVTATFADRPAQPALVLPATAGRLEIRGGGEVSSLGTSAAGGDVHVSAGQLELTGENSGLGSVATGDGNAGNVTVRVGDVNVTDWAAIASWTPAAGNAGMLSISAAGALNLSNGGIVDSSTFGAGNAGSVAISAGTMHVSGVATKVASQAQPGSTGHAGDVEVAVAGHLESSRWGSISSETSGTGDAGAVRIAAGSITLIDDGNIGSNTFGPGNAGSVRIDVAGPLLMNRHGYISSSTFAGGNGGSVVVRSGSLVMTSDSSILSQASHDSTGGHAGAVDIAVTGDLAIHDYSYINSSTYATGHAGTIKVTADTLTIDGAASIISSTFATGDAGTVEVSANNILISGIQAEIGSSTWAAGGGDAGHVTVSAAGTLTMAAGGGIDSSTFGTGNAGSVSVRAGNIAMDDAFITSDAARSLSGSVGSAGSVEIVSDGTIDMRNSFISSSTDSAGDSGDIRLAAGTLRLDNSSLLNQANFRSSGDAGLIVVLAGDVELRNDSWISSATFGSGNAGGVAIVAKNLSIDASGILGSAHWLSSGNAGSIDIDVKETASLVNNALISSRTYSAGDAGRITLHARNLVLNNAAIDSEAAAGSSGSGGLVNVAAEHSVRLRNNSVISSSTYGSGDAGGARVISPDIAMDQSFIASIAGDVATGNAGIVNVEAATALDIANGSLITSSTISPVGAAGTVQVKAGTLTITGSGDPAVRTGIASDAGTDSSGLVGDVSVGATCSIAMTDWAAISIINGSTAAPIPGAVGSLAITAPAIILRNQSVISAASLHDIPANAVVINVSDLLMLENSGIRTRANNGDGGDIRIGTPKVILLRDVRIATSVLGSTGNGGDIAIAGGALILDTGFIQANTAAANAAGGTVLIDVDQLLSSGNSLRVGGNTPYQFTPDVFGANVIQAAAPTGLSGNITISSPPTDIAGSLAELAAPALDLGAFGRDPCGRTAGSSLTTHGRGALPAGPGGFIQPSTPSGESSGAHPPEQSRFPATGERLALAVRCP